MALADSSWVVPPDPTTFVRDLPGDAARRRCRSSQQREVEGGRPPEKRHLLYGSRTQLNGTEVLGPKHLTSPCW